MVLAYSPRRLLSGLGLSFSMFTCRPGGAWCGVAWRQVFGNQVFDLLRGGRPVGQNRVTGQRYVLDGSAEVPVDNTNQIQGTHTADPKYTQTLRSDREGGFKGGRCRGGNGSWRLKALCAGVGGRGGGSMRKGGESVPQGFTFT
jgi:hypothetical protein